jgi:copper homeostasis protein
MASLPARPRLLEIPVETMEAALAAERGGADRIELCANLDAGGTTPTAEMMRAAREQIQLPIFVMVRPRQGDFVYTDDEFAAMKRAIEFTKDSGMDGVVLGLLKEDFQVDVRRTRALVELARPMPVTFHRAFDECRDLEQALEDVVKTGATRLLTSGGKPTSPEGAEIIGKLTGQAANRITVMPGSGIHSGNVARVAAETGAREFHAGLSGVVPHRGKDFIQFEMEVRKLAEQVKNLR